MAGPQKTTTNATRVETTEADMTFKRLASIEAWVLT
jgi:hypothetical protein